MIDMHAEGVGRVAGLLEQVAARALNPEPAFGATVDRVIVAEKRLFASSARIKADKDATKQRKRRDKRPAVRANADKPLRATGKLEEFLTTRGPGAQPITLTSDEMLFGVPGGRHEFHYARYQAKHGRNPLVSAAVVRRAAMTELEGFLTHAE